MSRLTANYESKRQDGIIVSVPVKASTTIYKEGMLVDKGTGFAEPGTDGSGYILIGVAMEGCDNSAGADGAKTVRVWKTGVFEYTKASAAQTDLGTAVYVHDDQTVGASSTNSVLAGYVAKYVDSTHVGVRIDLAAK
jgi:predicted RecA/RadA family phage recombinase